MGLHVTLNPNGVGLETLKAPLMGPAGVQGPTAPLQPLLPVATLAQVALAQQNAPGAPKPQNPPGVANKPNDRRMSAQTNQQLANQQSSEQEVKSPDSANRPPLEGSAIMALVARQESKKYPSSGTEKPADDLIPSTV